MTYYYGGGLSHYGRSKRDGAPVGSGRYRLGSGKRPNQSLSDEDMKKAIAREGVRKQYNKIANRKTENTKRILDASSNLVNQAQKMNRESMNTEKPRMDLSKMSNKELQDRITRENLEIQYNRLFNESAPEVSKGKQVLDNILSVVGSTLTIGSSALAIALAVKELKSA